MSQISSTSSVVHLCICRSCGICRFLELAACGGCIAFSFSFRSNNLIYAAIQIHKTYTTRKSSIMFRLILCVYFHKLDLPRKRPYCSRQWYGNAPPAADRVGIKTTKTNTSVQFKIPEYHPLCRCLVLHCISMQPLSLRRLQMPVVNEPGV